jgi:hypothetical protein
VNVARFITTLFIIFGPLIVLAVDWAVDRLIGYEATITAVVRDAAAVSALPETVYLVGALALWAHLFRGWL